MHDWMHEQVSHSRLNGKAGGRLEGILIAIWCFATRPYFFAEDQGLSTPLSFNKQPIEAGTEHCAGAQYWQANIININQVFLPLFCLCPTLAGLRVMPRLLAASSANLCHLSWAISRLSLLSLCATHAYHSRHRFCLLPPSDGGQVKVRPLHWVHK